MSNMYIDVATFIAACEQEKNESNIRLYRNLIGEEFGEFLEAYDADDKVEQLDA